MTTHDKPAQTPRSPLPATLSPVEPQGWPRPKGYSNGMVGRGRTLFVAGQIGWTPEGKFETDDLVEQFGQALRNVLAIVREAGGDASHIARMTVYVTDLDTYRICGPLLAPVWRDHMGKHFPAMALVGVAGLVELRAKVEIEATALLP